MCAMNVAGSDTKWSEGKTATVAPGSCREIHWTGKRIPAAVPRSLGWTSTCGGSGAAHCSAKYRA